MPEQPTIHLSQPSEGSQSSEASTPRTCWDNETPGATCAEETTDNELDKCAWFGEAWGTGYHPVGQKQPNQWGLYDMHGNVWEWVADTYHDDYVGAPRNESIWGDLDNQKAKTLRGGPWGHDALYMRGSSRIRHVPYGQGSTIGLRVVVGAPFSRP